MVLEPLEIITGPVKPVELARPVRPVRPVDEEAGVKLKGVLVLNCDDDTVVITAGGTGSKGGRVDNEPNEKPLETT